MLRASPLHLKPGIAHRPYRLGPLEATAEIVEEEEEIETGLEDQKEEDGVESSLPLAEE